MVADANEKDLQESFTWARTEYFSDYARILGYYQVQSCLEYSHGDSALDLACGDGLLTEMFSQHFKRIVGVDASSTHIAKARERLPAVELHESLIEDFFTVDKFDMVFLLNVLEHVIDPVGILQKAASFLKDDGALVIQVPNANALNRKLAVLMGTLKHCEELSPFDLNVAGHRRYYTLESLRADLIAADLHIHATGGIFYKMLSSPQLDWFLKNGLWQEGGFGWGRVGAEQRDWRAEFSRACYELGRERPTDCNLIYAVVTE